ncbi:MAG: tetratricopeptide repeat protein [Deltaproteobacteria bacterium]|nr:tetratricopeptide repeat protein [Deltaproteobacteria bacterium]
MGSIHNCGARKIKVKIVVGTCLSLFLFAEAGYAESRKEQARSQFDQGKDFFNKGRYEQAAIALQRAYELRPSFKILYYIGWAEAEIESYARAFDAFNLYLDKGGDSIPASRAREVAVEIEKLQELVGVVEIDCGADGAVVLVDGERRGLAPLAISVIVDLGRHVVVIAKDGEELHKEVIRVAGGQRVFIDFLADSNETKPTTDEETARPRRIWTWVAYGLGGAAAAGAVVTGSLSLSWASDVNSECNGDLCSGNVEAKARKVEKLSWVTNGLVGVAVAGVVAGTLLYFLEPGLAEGEETARLVPMLALEGGGLAVSGKF